MPNLLEDINSIKGKIIRSEPMKKHTSLKVGGPAELFFKPVDTEDLSIFFSKLRDSVPIFWLGRGSNLLVRDGGISGVVISSSSIFRQINMINDTLVEVGASVPCTMLAKQCIRWGMAPSEFFSGIPGSFGGALAMNAGAFGHETWDRVISVNVINRKGEILKRDPTQYKVEYRNVKGPKNEWFIGALLEFRSDKTLSTEKQKEMLDLRKHTQPLGKASCGSVFRNPPDSFAARLIEQSNLKGYKIGGAYISNKHANFIINDGSASANDIERLIKYIRSVVKQNYDIELHCEVKIVGNN